MKDDNPPVTQEELNQGLSNLKREIVDEISEVLADAMTNIGMNFQNMQTNFDELKDRMGSLENRVENIEDKVQKIEIGQNRIEQKLDPTIERVDELSMRFAKLKPRPA